MRCLLQFLAKTCALTGFANYETIKTLRCIVHDTEQQSVITSVHQNLPNVRFRTEGEKSKASVKAIFFTADREIFELKQVKHRFLASRSSQ